MIFAMPRPLSEVPDTSWALSAYERKHHDPPQRSLVFYGDSDISQWDTDEVFPGSLNCGESGAQLKHARDFAPRMIEKYNPKIVVMVAGENDLADGTPPSKVLSDFELVYETITNGGAHLIYIGTKSEPATKGLQKAYRELNRLVGNFVQGKENVSFIDVYSTMLLNGRPDSSMFVEDGLHLSDVGYQVWNSLLTQELERLGK